MIYLAEREPSDSINPSQPVLDILGPPEEQETFHAALATVAIEGLAQGMISDHQLWMRLNNIDDDWVSREEAPVLARLLGVGYEMVMSRREKLARQVARGALTGELFLAEHRLLRRYFYTSGQDFVLEGLTRPDVLVLTREGFVGELQPNGKVTPIVYDDLDHCNLSPQAESLHPTHLAFQFPLVPASEERKAFVSTDNHHWAYGRVIAGRFKHLITDLAEHHPAFASHAPTDE